MTHATPDALSAPDRQLRRIRHETRRRMLTVVSAEMLTPQMRRIGLHSAELDDFVSASPDDHIKIMLPGTDGTTIMRDYTPRKFDRSARLLTVDFALHDAGPATAWALAARPGDQLQIGGPRGSVVVPDTFDWVLLVGDETALPAIGRRVEELRAGVPVTTIVTVDAAAEIQTFETAARWRGHWLCRDTEGADDTANAQRAIDLLFPKQGDGFVWIAGEAQFARALRHHVLTRHHHPVQGMKAAGYWIRGAEGAHQPLDGEPGS